MRNGILTIMKTALLVVLAIVLGFGIMYGYISLTKSPEKLQHPTSTATQSHFSLSNAPSDSLKGKVLSLAGDTKWESRNATAPAALNQLVTLQQGEEIVTGATGSMTIQFPKGISLNVSANSDVSFIQTLPQSMVFAQKSGLVKYTKTEDSPLFIRSNSLLLELQNGTISVAMNDAVTTVSVLSGNIKAAYNDIDTKSIVSSVSAGEKFVYDSMLKDGVIE